MNTAKCRSCGAEIIWAQTEFGKLMPMDAEPTILPGAFTLESQDGTSTKRARLVGRYYISHFATCPNAAEHRRS